MNRNNKKKYKCILANTQATWQQAAHTTYHLQAAEQEPYKRALLLMKTVQRTFWIKVRRMDH